MKNKKILILFILGIIFAFTVGAGATSLIYSKDVTYDNTASGLSSTTVQGALDELYEKAKNGGAKVSCNDNGECTVTCKQGDVTMNDTGYSCTNVVEVKCPNGKAILTTATGYNCIKLPVNEKNIITSGDGLYSDSTEDGSFYYSGANPNNNIVFNGEAYKILRIEKDGRIKIIKMESISTQAWDIYGNDSWNTSSLKKYLENTWLAAQENDNDYKYLNSSGSWYTGSVSSAVTTISSIYSNEKRGTIVTSPVGIISISEFLKAKNAGKTFLNYSNYWWTITRYPSYDESIWVVGSNISAAYGPTQSFPVFPVLYLKSDITLTGSGTSTDPYCIAGSNCPKNLDFTQRAS